ncbi:hypothetical protein IV500_00535 [Paeniglutamicibacter antarcticus]|uniref:Uncharacterized protein n=1 Tax=Arthrobacter terrae TaxID=2935737 RepID=A0A931CJ16_9MICC|nr:hypothetical protein [Arthrobacter terrae]MBG0737927.1 hypothetical protein [Arthrobacter terrae]
MGVHIGEVHTDVAAASGSGTHAAAAPHASPAAGQERWDEIRRTAEVLGWRTASEGFDD